MASNTARTARQVVSEEQLDDAIDAVAREMTELEPSGALRVKVLDGIERGRRHAAPIVPRWVWAPVAAIAVLAVGTGLWLAGPTEHPGVSEGSVAEGHAARPTRQATATPGMPVRPGDRPVETSAGPVIRPAPRGGRAALAPATSRGRPDAGTADTAAADFAALVPALGEIEPLRFSSVEPSPLDIQGVEVAPLDIAPMPDIPGLVPGSTDVRTSDPNKEKQP